jgi:hypothetical protein
MRTTATDIVNMHANLPPFKIIIHQHLHCATLCMATLPLDHLLMLLIRKAKQYVKAHQSPIHKLLHKYNIDLRRMEKIQSIQGGVQYKPKFEINIPPDKDAPKQAASEERADIVVYTDGSKTNGKVQVAATVLKNGQPKLVLWYHL